MQRTREHLRNRALLHDLARVHHDDAVGDLGHQRQAVGDEDHCEPALALQSG